MTDNVSVILHWNTDYAEIPRTELLNVIKKSYEPMITAFENWKDGTVCFNITGHTLDFLQKESPELIGRIKNLVKDDIVDILVTGYSHPILLLLPRERIQKQLADHIDLIKKIFGKTPKGFWPPELVVSPPLLMIAKELGINWTAIDYEHFLLSQHFGNDVNPFEMREKTITETLVDAFWTKGLAKLPVYLRALKILSFANKTQIHPLQRIIINENISMKAYLCSVSWSNSSQFAIGGHVPIYNLKKHMKSIIKAPTKILPLYASDIEFFGYRKLGPNPAQPMKLIAFLKELKKKGINTITPSKINDEEWPKDTSYITAGSWAPDKSLRIWTDSEDNSEFERRANEIYEILRINKWDQTLQKQLEPYLRIMENSDARGWAPLPERKLEAYSAINTIFRILKEKKN